MKTWLAEFSAGWDYAFAVWTRRMSAPAFVGFWGAIAFMSLMLKALEALVLWACGCLR